MFDVIVFLSRINCNGYTGSVPVFIGAPDLAERVVAGLRRDRSLETLLIQAGGMGDGIEARPSSQFPDDELGEYRRSIKGNLISTRPRPSAPVHERAAWRAARLAEGISTGSAPVSDDDPATLTTAYVREWETFRNTHCNPENPDRWLDTTAFHKRINDLRASPNARDLRKLLRRRLSIQEVESLIHAVEHFGRGHTSGMPHGDHGDFSYWTGKMREFADTLADQPWVEEGFREAFHDRAFPQACEALLQAAGGAGSDGGRAEAASENSYLTHPDLVKMFKLSEAEAEQLRKRLERWRPKHADSMAWRSTDNPKTRDATYTYRLAAVRPIIDEITHQK